MCPSVRIFTSETCHDISMKINVSGLFYDCSFSVLYEAEIEFVRICLELFALYVTAYFRFLIFVQNIFQYDSYLTKYSGLYIISVSVYCYICSAIRFSVMNLYVLLTLCPPNIAFDCLAFLFHIRNFLGSQFDTEAVYPD
jgi:hypothetical protein